jgi:uncharacterized membrane protein YhaH (DUF805 family)
MTNEELSQKILNDIQYIKEIAEFFQKRLVDYQLDEKQLHEIRSVLNYFRTADFTFISTLDNQERLLNLENQFSSYKISIEVFLDASTQQRLNNFLANNSKMYEFMENIINLMKEEFTPDSQESRTDELQEIYKRIDLLENKPDDLIKEAEKTLNEIDKLQVITEGKERKSTQIYEKIQKIANDTEQKAKELILNLEKMRDREISIELAIQLEDKSKKLRKESNGKFLIFLISIILLFIFNLSLLNNYLASTDINTTSALIFSTPHISKLDFWQFMTMKLIINIPFLIFIAFALNEYSKSNKLYEEYEFRRISAITLFNNYSRLINELNMEKEDLHESLKSSLDKIFDNPVHSIYGDKSGDKNIGLDQLEKITSIIEKMKK